jgi:RecJ-like exonuclease
LGKEIKKKSQSKAGKTVNPKNVKTTKVPEVSGAQKTPEASKEIQVKPGSLKATFNYYHRWVVVDGVRETLCPRCGGWGPVYELNCYRRECPDCKGDGKITGCGKGEHCLDEPKSLLVWEISTAEAEKKIS